MLSKHNHRNGSSDARRSRMRLLYYILRFSGSICPVNIYFSIPECPQSFCVISLDKSLQNCFNSIGIGRFEGMGGAASLILSKLASAV